MDRIDSIYEAVLSGNQAVTEAETRAALEEGVDAETILYDGLVDAMREVGDQFEDGSCFVPEMLVAARAMKAGLGVLRPLLAEDKVETRGKVLLGTVQGDIHDIGKNLVGMMLEGAGFEIVDLGVNVAPELFVNAIREQSPDLVALSALLTTTMPHMSSIIDAMNAAGVRDQVKVIVGGAPVTEEYAKSIGADGFAKDAGQAGTLALSLIS